MPTPIKDRAVVFLSNAKRRKNQETGGLFGCLVIHLFELELGHLEPGHGPLSREGLDIFSQSLHVLVGLLA